MAKIYIRSIQSSSKNNSIVLYDGFTNLFLDFGAEHTNINNYFLKYNQSFNSVAGVLITHYHIDHTRSISKKDFNSFKFYLSSQTLDYLKNNYEINLNNFYLVSVNSDKWIKIKGSNWKFKTFKTIHNAAGSIGFLIKNKNSKILYLTDTEPLDNKLFKNNNAYIVECNYATSFLDTNAEINKHINKKTNHMNIFDTENFLKKYFSKKMKVFIFSHISINGKKDKELIEKTVNLYNGKEGLKVKYINPYTALDFEIDF